jgi:prepilin-type N-terminal cleavage/methylation domain-containing protein
MGMDGLRPRCVGIRRDERGFTLPEVMTTIAIMGILIAIAIILWLGLLEQRRVDAATNQLISDMRLAHTSATNQLTDWRIVLDPERGESGSDYYLVRLAAPYPESSITEPVEVIPRTFPGNVKVVNIAGVLDTGSTWAVAPSAYGRTRTLEFNPDGTMRFYQGVSGSTCVTVDGDPENRVTVLAATSRAKVSTKPC